MKQKLFILAFVHCILLSFAHAQDGCLETQPGYNSPFPSETFLPTCSGYPEVIITTARTGSFSKVQLTTNNSYIFSSSKSTDFITIGNEDGTMVLASGTAEVSFESEIDQIVRFYVHADSDCNYELDTFRVKMVQCGDIQPPLENDGCDGAIPLSNGDTASGSTITATDSGGFVARDVFYSYTGTGFEKVTVSLCGSDFDTHLNVYNDCSLIKEVARDDDSCPDGSSSELSFFSEGGVTYYIMVEGKIEAEGNYTIAITTEEATIPETCDDHAVPLDNVADGYPFDNKIFIDIPIGETGSRIIGMDIATFGETTGGFTATLYSNLAGAPDQPIQTVATEILSEEIFFEFMGFNFVNYSISFETPFELQPNTIYWLEIESDAMGWLFTSDPSEVIGSYGLLFDPTYQIYKSTMAEFAYTLDCEELLSAEDLEKSEFSYYPNPVTNTLNFRSAKEIKSVSVYNLAGQKLLTNSKISNNEINLSVLPAGTYVFRAELENGQIETFKIMKR